MHQDEIGKNPFNLHTQNDMLMGSASTVPHFNGNRGVSKLLHLMWTLFSYPTESFMCTMHLNCTSSMHLKHN